MLADHSKLDSTFVPINNSSTTRWHASVQGCDFELLLTGPKFFDIRFKKDGGGAIYLEMYLFRADFKTATGILRMRSP